MNTKTGRPVFTTDLPVFMLVYRKTFQCFYVMHGKFSRHHLFVRDIPDFHVIICLQRHRHNVPAIQGFIDDTTADGIAIQADQQVKQCCPVTDPDVFPALQRT